MFLLQLKVLQVFDDENYLNLAPVKRWECCVSRQERPECIRCTGSAQRPSQCAERGSPKSQGRNREEHVSFVATPPGLHHDLQLTGADAA